MPGIRGLQSLITELRPAALDELGVEPAVEALLGRTASITGLAIDARIELAQSSATRVDLDLATAVYRLVQEALTNAAKHAGAERASVEIVEEPDSIGLTVPTTGRALIQTMRTAGSG
jgi:signal transduction histidine kinase